MKEWLISVASVITTTSVAEILLPSGRIKRICKTVLSLVCLLVLISPLSELKNADISISDIQDRAEQSEIFRENLKEYYERLAESLVENALSDKGLTCVCETEGELDSENRFTIKKAFVIISDNVLTDKDGNIISIEEITGFLSEKLDVEKERVIVYVG